MARIIDFKTRQVLADLPTIQSVKRHKLYTYHSSVGKYSNKLYVLAIYPDAAKGKLFLMYQQAEQDKKVGDV